MVVFQTGVRDPNLGFKVGFQMMNKQGSHFHGLPGLRSAPQSGKAHSRNLRRLRILRPARGLFASWSHERR